MAGENIYKWSLIERMSIAAINFGGNIVLARMLTATDFGLLAMVAVIIATSFNLSSCGLSDGLIHKLNPKESDYSTVFVFNSAMGLLIGIAAIVSAGKIARFFGHEELVWVMRMYGVCFFFQTMSFVQETRMRKQLEMKKLCIARVGATATALALGIVLAVLGCGYWALISTQIFVSFFMFAYIVGLSRWFPKLQFKTKAFKEFFSYGIHLMLTYIINVVEQNVNTFVLGRYYTSSQTGLYSQGAKLANVPFSVTEASINSPFFVEVSNEPDETRKRLKVFDMMGNIVAINASISLLLVLIAYPAIEFLYGSKWIDSAPIMQILSVFGCFMCIKYFYQTIFKVYNHTGWIKNLSICEFVVQLALLVIFMRRGVAAIALTQLAAVCVSVWIYGYITARMLAMTLKDVYLRLLRPLWYPLLAFGAGFGAKELLTMVNLPALVQCLAIALPFCGILLIGLEINRPTLYLKIRSKIIR